MKVTTIGIDLAKNIFHIHGVDGRGGIVLRKQLKRAQVTNFFVNLPACLIGMEALRERALLGSPTHSSRRRCQSRFERARRDTSRANTAPT
jgi:transposase